MTKRILLIGNGAREHAIAETLKSSTVPCELYAYASAVNPGIKKISNHYQIGNLVDVNSIAQYAFDRKIDWSIIGPEAPLAAGVVDELEEAGIPSVGPHQKLAQLESSKSFTRNFLAEHKIDVSPRFRVFTNIDEVEDWAREMEEGFVIKPDGLTGGKGVIVAGDHFNDLEEGIRLINQILEKEKQVVVEEKLVGQEFSLMSLCDGKSILHLPAVQDHKRAYDGDIGPNTGGMGSYSAANFRLPFLNFEDIKKAREINKLTARAIGHKFGIGYKGVLYGGFIATREGVKLIEYNVRFGDPEAMNVLSVFPSLDSFNFLKVCQAIIDGNLGLMKPRFRKVSTVCKYLVPQGYPENPIKNQPIDVSAVDTSKVKIFYAAVDERDDGLYLTGSRAVALVGIHEDIYEAEDIVSREISKIKGEMFYREDIGTRGLIMDRISMMMDLRGDSV